MTDEKTKKIARKAALAALILSSLLVAAKAFAWMQSGSAALLASLVDSFIDALISATNFMAIRYALKPADDDHRYGHGKMEGVAALVQAAFIGGSCVFVLLEALRSAGDPAPVTSVGLSVSALLIATLVTLMLTRYQTRAAKRTRSLAVEADANHYMGDIAINLGVIASLLAGAYLGWLWIDPLAAVLVAGWLLYSARKIGLKAINMLLDREIEEDKRNEILNIIKQTPGVEGLHDMRTRRSGIRMMVSFDIEVDPALTLNAAHEISRAVEENILKKFKEAEVMIHIDPRGDITDSRHKKMEIFHAH